MEKRSYNPEKFKLNLKHLPPIDPSTISPASKYEKHKPNARPFVPKAKTRPKEGIKVAEFDDASKKMGSVLDNDYCVPQDLKVGDGSFCSTKYIDPNSTNKISTKTSETRTEICQTESKNEDAPSKVSAKSQLHEVCAANNWKSPLFECCKEEGPDHTKLFTYRVTFVIESSNTILECFGAPRSKKKTAAEHAAEGALWYLELLGYFPIKK